MVSKTEKIQHECIYTLNVDLYNYIYFNVRFSSYKTKIYINIIVMVLAAIYVIHDFGLPSDTFFGKEKQAISSCSIQFLFNS